MQIFGHREAPKTADPGKADPSTESSKEFDVDVDHLLDEETWGQVTKASFQFSFDWWEWLVPLLSFLVTIYTSYSLAVPSLTLLQLLTRSADASVSYTTTMLGFLIAGFAILTALNRPHLFKMMNSFADSEIGRWSFFKGIFLRFFRVFVVFWVLLTFSIILSFLFNDNGFATFAFKPNLNVSPTSWRLPSFTLSWILGILVGLFSYSLITLQTFIFNLYYFVMLCVSSDVRLLIEEETMEQIKKNSENGA